ncbi:MAG TPA: ABC transporter permease, partial [Pyrinomonadaceae bacterium]|nr:ABC transporter permease [Pyrinomonadaceae bacterium]
MNKFLAVVKREYIQRVRTKMFIVATVLGPVMMALFTVVPAILTNMKTGGPVRIAIVDETGVLYEQVREAILTGRQDEEEEEPTGDAAAASAANENSMERMRRTGAKAEAGYDVRQVALGGETVEAVKRRLDEQVKRDELDAYLILPADLLQQGEARYYSRNTGDVFTRGQLEDRLTRAVRNQRMAVNNISPALMGAINKPVKLRAARAGDESEREDKGQGFVMVFVVGFLIYMTILMYGQLVLAAVIEEKETRISEVLFSSIRSFPLMMGKLIGVSLVALTQLLIWGLAFALFALYGAGMLAAGGVEFSMPDIPASFILYFFLFFLLGYFIYATIYALVGAMVTTAQEGGQVALPVILLLVIGFYLAFPVIRSPNSGFAFWVSMVPFFLPITMLVRVVTQTPPVWQILLSLFIGVATVV